MQSANSEVHDPENKEKKPVKNSGTSQKPCNLESLPAGLMGKMLVYRNGAVKLKIGDTLYDVSFAELSHRIQCRELFEKFLTMV